MEQGAEQAKQTAATEVKDLVGRLQAGSQAGVEDRRFAHACRAGVEDHRPGGR